MKRFYKPFVLSFFCFLFFAGSVKAQRSEADLLKHLCAIKFEWQIDRQTDSLSKILHDSLLYIHSNGLIESKSDVIHNIETAELVYKKIELGALTVRFAASTALITGSGLFTGRIGHHDFSVGLLFTEVYVKQPDGWKLISRHANKLD